MPVPLTVGSRLGSAYILDGPVGAGAQGEVWLAHADADPHTPLAVKILRADLVEDAGVVERFIRERSTLMRVRSPYVVGVRDMVIEGTRFAIVMDHVGGGDLRGHLTDVGPLPPAEVARVGEMLAQGLAAVHAAGIVHRDLKPANVLIDDSAPTPLAAQTMSVASYRSSPSDRTAFYGSGPDTVVPYGTAGGAAPADPGAATTPYGTVGAGLPAYSAAGTPPSPVTPGAALTSGPGAAQDAAPGVSSSGATTTGSWIPRLADFGVARLCDTVSASLATGAIGTPLYMAPEILDSTAPTPAADIYSMGVVLYEASCGVTPFVGAPSQVLASHLRFIPGRPDGVPDALWNLIGRMLAKQPAERPSAAAVAEELRRMAPSFAGLPAARRLEEPPRGPLCDTPFISQSAEDAITTRTGASPAPPGAVAPLGPDDATAPYAGARTIGYDLRTQPLPGSSALPPPTQTSPASAAPVARRRRGRLIGAVATAVVLCLVGAGLWVWWSRGRGADQAATIAALPAQARLVELQRIPESWEYTASPDGGALAVEDFDTWSLYNLSAADQSAVWSGKCSSVRFWTNAQILCESSASDTLVSLDGSETTELPGPAERSFVGTTGTAAIVVDGSYEGSLVAIDAKGTELWRRDGGYQKGLVTKHFITTYENGSNRIQVLSAATGEVLLSEPLESAPDFDTELPGGVGTDVGGEAFYVDRSGTVTVYDATGAQVGVVNDAPSRASWVASAPLSPGELVDLLKIAARGGVAVRGARSTVTIDVDTTTCTATGPDSVSYPVPERADGEACVIRPLGLVGGDSAVLFSMGQPSTISGATGEQVIAYDLDGGQQTWQTPGTLLTLLPGSAQAAGDAADKPRLLLVQPGRANGDLVIAAVIAT